MRRSARRQTVRATCSAAPAGAPPARMKRRSGGSSASSRSISCSSRATSSSPSAAFVTRGGDLVAGIGELGAEREQIALNVHELRRRASASSADGAGEAEPGVELVDFAVRVDARVVFRDARAVEERCLAGVAGARVDFHGRRLYEMPSTRHESRSALAGLPPPPDRRRFRQRLLTWYRRHGRDLPWRKTDDPYHILVSEIMLQQTQVDRVLPKYAEWLDKYPSLDALADAPEHEVTEDLVSARLQHPAEAAADASRASRWRATAASCRPTRRRCCRSRASAPTRPARSAASRFASAPPFSTPTSRACCSACSSATGDPKSHAMKRHLWTRLRNARAGAARVRLQSGADGLRRDGLRRAQPEVPGLPDGEGLPRVPVHSRRMTTIVVTAAVIERDGRFLVTRRQAASTSKASGSFPAANAIRARRSTAASRASCAKSWTSTRASATSCSRRRTRIADRRVELHFFRASCWASRAPQLGQEMRWVARGELRRLQFPPADAELIAAAVEAGSDKAASTSPQL